MRNHALRALRPKHIQHAGFICRIWRGGGEHPFTQPKGEVLFCGMNCFEVESATQRNMFLSISSWALGCQENAAEKIWNSERICNALLEDASYAIEPESWFLGTWSWIRLRVGPHGLWDPFYGFGPKSFTAPTLDGVTLEWFLFNHTQMMECDPYRLGSLLRHYTWEMVLVFLLVRKTICFTDMGYTLRVDDGSLLQPHMAMAYALAYGTMVLYMWESFKSMVGGTSACAMEYEIWTELPVHHIQPSNL